MHRVCSADGRSFQSEQSPLLRRYCGTWPSWADWRQSEGSGYSRPNGQREEENEQSERGQIRVASPPSLTEATDIFGILTENFAVIVPPAISSAVFLAGRAAASRNHPSKILTIEPRERDHATRVHPQQIILYWNVHLIHSILS